MEEKESPQSLAAKLMEHGFERICRQNPASFDGKPVVVTYEKDGIILHYDWIWHVCTTVHGPLLCSKEIIAWEDLVEALARYGINI